MRKPRTLAKTLREAKAMLTQARYLSRDLKPRAHLGEGPTVILLHGLYASAGVFTPLRRRLEGELGASTFTISYPPGPGIVELAGRVRELFSQITSPAPIHLVGHSLGGLVLRHVARQKWDPRVVETISLAAPFRGSEKVWLVPGQAGRDLLPGGPLLLHLSSRTPEDEGIAHLTLVAADDEMILPGAFPEYGRHQVVERTGHNGILFSEEAIDAVVRTIAEFGQR